MQKVIRPQRNPSNLILWAVACQFSSLTYHTNTDFVACLIYYIYKTCPQSSRLRDECSFLWMNLFTGHFILLYICRNIICWTWHRVFHATKSKIPYRWTEVSNWLARFHPDSGISWTASIFANFALDYSLILRMLHLQTCSIVIWNISIYAILLQVSFHGEKNQRKLRTCFTSKFRLNWQVSYNFGVLSWVPIEAIFFTGN